MRDLVTYGWFSGDAFVRAHSDGTIEIQADGARWRGTPDAWMALVSSSERMPQEHLSHMGRDVSGGGS